VTTRRRTMPVPLGPIHRRLWRTFWRRCSCGLSAPCIDRRVPAPVPFPNLIDVPTKLPDAHTADHVAGDAGSRDTAARPTPAPGQGLRVSAAGRTAARRWRDAVLMTQEHPSSRAPIRTPHIPSGSTPSHAAIPASRRSDSVPNSRRDRRPTRAPAATVMAERTIGLRGGAGVSALMLPPAPTGSPAEAPTTVEPRPPTGGQADATRAALRPRPAATGGRTHTTTTRQIATADGTTRRTHTRSPGRGGRPRGWGSEIGRAGRLTPAQHHRTGGGIRDDGRGAE
jgi:hypothetical protein